MLNKLLRKIGLVRISELSKTSLTEAELAYLLSEKLSDVDFVIDKKTEDKIYETARGVDGLTNLFREMAAKDVRRYFGATSQREQDIIRGSFSRTNYIHARLVGEKKTKLDGLRYS